MIQRIDTSRFFNSHLKQPKGHGLWMFEDKTGDIVFEHTGNYSKAKKAAQTFAADNRTFLYVCP